MKTVSCSDCREVVSITSTQCPHCGRPSLFPNLNSASTQDEIRALDSRLFAARADLKARSADTPGNECHVVLSSTEAIINRYAGELQRLAWSDDQVYATYYQKVNAGLQLPEGDRWNRLRGIADAVLFGDYGKGYVRFGVLSLDNQGVDRYGECSMVLRRTMIEHRATVFEENSVVFMKRHRISGSTDFELPPGYRTTWPRRNDLGLAKLANRIQRATTANEFSRILITNGATPEDDDFIEVHIWGSLTIRSFQNIVVKKWTTALSDAEKLALNARLTSLGISFNFP